MSVNGDLSKEMWQHYFERLSAFAQKRLHHATARTVDGDDIANSALHSFYKGCKAGRYTRDGSADPFWGLLMTIALRKIATAYRKELSLKRGQGLVRGESIFDAADGASDGGLDQFPELRNMPELPEQVFASCQNMLVKLNDERLRQTALLRLQGFSNLEIAELTHSSLARTKQRVSRIKQIWTDYQADLTH